jgi:uncharacterized membrane protein|tara:strand:+ start:1921 stop:2118 length:198 start_codon:yes stop_codon:yes gene_type:complete
MKFIESDIAKVAAYRVISIIITCIFTYFYFGELAKSLAFTLGLMFILTIAHYVFEKWWNKISVKK